MAIPENTTELLYEGETEKVFQDFFYLQILFCDCFSRGVFFLAKLFPPSFLLKIILFPDVRHV